LIIDGRKNKNDFKGLQDMNLVYRSDFNNIAK